MDGSTPIAEAISNSPFGHGLVKALANVELPNLASLETRDRDVPFLRNAAIISAECQSLFIPATPCCGGDYDKVCSTGHIQLRRAKGSPAVAAIDWRVQAHRSSNRAPVGCGSGLQIPTTVFCDSDVTLTAIKRSEKQRQPRYPLAIRCSKFVGCAQLSYNID